MNKTPAVKKSVFVDMLGGGYFPKELPPTFTTRLLAECALKHETKNCILDAPDSVWRQHEIHNLARSGSLSRELAIVNPVSYWRLARLISKEWNPLKAAAEISNLSITRPITSQPRSLPWGRDIHAARAKVRSQGKFLLTADIANFFGSIYTHTIPWALHTKKQSRKNLKQKPTPTLLGDNLDTLFRAMQDGQSIGLPVGPDASLLIAEIILSRIDEDVFNDQLENGFRFVDDYELVFNSEEEALSARNKLQACLAQYRLTLNPLKTKIVRLPTSLDNNWSRDLWRIVSNEQNLSRTDIIDFFDKAFETAEKNPAAGVLKFSLGKICKKAFSPTAIDIAFNLVLQCARVEVGCIPFVLTILMRPEMKKHLRSQDLSKLFSSIIKEHAPQRHSNEVAWALWGSIALGLEISPEIAELAIKTEDSVCSLLCLHAKNINLIKDLKNEIKNWKNNLGEDDLVGQRWLLTYELARLGVTTDTSGRSYVHNDQHFGFLINQGVAFFDDTKFYIPKGLLPTLSFTVDAEESSNNEDDNTSDEDHEEEDEEYSLGGFWDEWSDWDELDEEDMEAFNAYMKKILHKS